MKQSDITHPDNEAPFDYPNNKQLATEEVVIQMDRTRLSKRFYEYQQQDVIQQRQQSAQKVFTPEDQDLLASCVKSLLYLSAKYGD